MMSGDEVAALMKLRSLAIQHRINPEQYDKCMNTKLAEKENEIPELEVTEPKEQPSIQLMNYVAATDEVSRRHPNREAHRFHK